MKEKTVVVTGGLSGLRKAASMELASRGCHVIIFDYADDKSEPVLKGIRDKGGKADYLPCD